MSPLMVLTLGVGAVFAGIVLALSLIGVATAEKRGVSRSLATIQALNAAPDVLRQELERPFSERVLAPLGLKLVGLGRRLTAADTADRLRHRLNIAGNPAGWDVDRLIGMKVLGFGVLLGVAVVGCMVVGTSLPVMLVVCVGAALLGYAAPNLVLKQVGDKREADIRRALPDALDLLTISVEAGLAFDAAVGRVARNTAGPLSQELSRVLQEMQIGVGRMEALRALGERSTLAELRGFVTAMVQADAFGVPIGQVLRVQSTEMRVKRRQRAEEAAQKVPVKILFPLIFCILPTLFLIILGPAGITIMENMGGMGK
ncbi:MAG: type II secretion system F family protein [Propionibacteriales bacterium]|nr:type II secretion system F family protein [Propionibacteriales bacterium]